MALIKHDIPILEYDDSQHAVIMPTHDNLDIKLPSKAVFAFLGDVIETYAESNKNKAEKIAEFISATKVYPVYIVDYEGEDICLCQAPVGSAASTQILDWLIGYGVTKVISSGTCGALAELPENTFLVPTKALRDEGTSYHYLPPSRYVNICSDALYAIEKVFQKCNIPYLECMTWTTDGFYRETREKVMYRKEEGCMVVEMECASLAACAEFRDIKFGQILFTADTLANIDAYDERNWGEDSFEKALYICLDIVHEM
ncbi:MULTISPECIES: nucleoside phosphorylase [Sellimonas]|uniref:Uridine phosphorylase n=1 Tax=Sellimonas caecigallum TaxID=2592333 RepID=A0ABS7L7P0_9FIRM|nr:nucleoside phosphorylase [Sellimonas caecigallum]MBY0759113.1 nucleoside phosphorylase [Sellimonas caecigallum]